MAPTQRTPRWGSDAKGMNVSTSSGAVCAPLFTLLGVVCLCSHCMVYTCVLTGTTRVFHVTGWQTPYVDVFTHFDVTSGKKCSKTGDVTRVMDKTLRKHVYRIYGNVLAGNCLSLPKALSQSLGLVGSQLYVLFRVPGKKYFAMHFDIGTENGVTVRISVSNTYQEFKATSTWLQFPFELKSQRWSLLHLDVKSILSIFTSHTFSCIRGMQFCSCLYVKGAFTSGIIFDDPESVPRAMRFPVTGNTAWSDLYDHIKFPTETPLAVAKDVELPPPHPAVSAQDKLTDVSTVCVCICVWTPYVCLHVYEHRACAYVY